MTRRLILQAGERIQEEIKELGLKDLEMILDYIKLMKRADHYQAGKEQR